MEFNLERGVQDGVRIGKMIGGFLAVLSRPLSLATQALLKKNMGERYFATWHAVIALCLIFLAGWASFQDTKSVRQTTYDQFGRSVVVEGQGRVSPTTVYVVVGVWVTAFAFATLVHRSRIKQRYQQGQPWHSRCSGEPIVEQLRPWARYLATAGIGLGLYKLKLEPIAGLVWISLIATMLGDEWERWLFYNAVLDAVDGQLESEYLARAVDERLTPTKARGVTAPLPSYVADAFRSKVAEAIRRGNGGRKGSSPVADSEVEGKPAKSSAMASAKP